MPNAFTKISEIFNESEKFKSHLEEAMKIKQKNFGDKIYFYAPSFAPYTTSDFRSIPNRFPSISITGNKCALKCKHCNSKVLQTMIPALTPDRLINVCKGLKEKGSIGCLISGGCTSNLSVPLDKFIDAIAYIKKFYEMKIVVHTGIIDSDTARRLKEAEIDAAMIDVIGSNKTIKEIYHSNVTVHDYEESLSVLHENDIPLVPHVLVGLHYGILKGELRALEIISEYSPSAVVIIAFTPIKGTSMERVNPASPEDITKVLIGSRLMFPTTPIVLGCMRPTGKHRVKTDIYAVKAGVNAIAFPDEEAIEVAKNVGLDIKFSPLCCSQIYEDVRLKKNLKNM